MDIKCPINCILCDKSLDNILEDGNQPNDGLAFFTAGHYGTTVFDPMDGTRLEINVCDDCLKKAGAAGNVLMSYPQPAPPRGPLVKWPNTIVEKMDDLLKS